MSIQSPPSLEEIRRFIKAPDMAIPSSPAPVSTPAKEKPATPITEDAASPKGVLRGNKLVTTVGFSVDLLRHIEAASKRLNISRTAFINMACTRMVKEVYRDYQEQLKG